MVRSGELPMRLMSLKYGADLVWGPETIDKSMIGTTRRVNPVTGMVEYSRYCSNGVSLKKSSAAASSQENGQDNGCGESVAPACQAEAQAQEPTAPAADEHDNQESILFRIHPTLETAPKKLIFQLGTASPETAVAAATLVAKDVAGIDVNSGCPKPFSTSGGMGAALLKDPDRLASILTALVERVGRPFEIGISVKIRLLHDEQATVGLVKRLCATGISALTVHCRMVHMRPRERALRDQIPGIVRACHEAGVPCILNGDVTSRDDAMELMKTYGADGAMIATSAEKNPTVFTAGAPVVIPREKVPRIVEDSSCLALLSRDSQQGGPIDPRVNSAWMLYAREYLRIAIDVGNRWANTKFSLSQLIPGKEAEARDLAKARMYVDGIRLLGMLSEHEWESFQE